MSSAAETTLVAGPLRVTFTWQGDRFAHAIDVLTEGQWQPALVSLEGTPEERWPASPVFQSLHVETRDGGITVALLVGMAGKSHWSASIEFDPQAGCVRYDLACRVRDAAAANLTSTYHVLGAGCQLSEDAEVPSQFIESAGQRVVRPKPVAGTGAATFRWAYRVLAR